jgi:hypothetical protein
MEFRSDWIVGFIVAGAAGYWLRRFYYRFGAGMLSKYLLKRKRIAWAMKIRAHANSAKCGGDCACD